MSSITTRAINIKTEVPGPKGREILARREVAVSRGLGRSTPVVVASAHDALVTDVDGNTYIDFAGGIGVLAGGHTPAFVVDVLKQQAEELIHICSIVATTESYVELCEILNKIVPGNFPKKSMLSNTGAEAVENAIRCARAYTGRPAVICFEGAYHGRTLLTMTLTSKYDLYKKGFGPFASDVYRLPFPSMYRRPDGLSEEQYIDWLIKHFDLAMTSYVDPSAVAAVIVEPVQGEAGFIPAPKRWLEHIAKRCKEHGIVLVIDEVQTGFGRTGTMFAIEQYNVEPDIVITAKSMGSGMPISAITGRAEVLDGPHISGMGGTYGGSPLACVAAIKTIELIQQQNLPARAVELGKIIRREFDRWHKEIPLVGDVRGMGAMLAVELVTDRETKTPAKEQTLPIIQEAARHGVIMIRAGMYSNCLRILVPLVIPEEQLLEGLEVVEAAIKTIVSGTK